MDFLKDLSIDKVRNLAEDTLNQVKPKTDVEARVYEALSHKNWGTSSTLLNEIARDTYDFDRFPVVSRLMWEALENQRPAAWRVVFKGLTMLEHMVKNGSERCVDDARNHGHVLRSLQQFNYYEGTIDRGVGVREKSKQMLEILGDDDSIREERQKARKLRERFGGKLSAAAGGGGGEGDGGGGGGNSNYGGYGKQGGWENGGGGGGGASGGYGDGGIGSTSNRNAAYDNGGGFSGRYGGSESQPQGGTAPTFAALPPEGKKVKKSKKKGSSSKKKEGGAAATSEPAVDLFSFDDPSPAAAPVAAAPAANDDFGAFAGASSGNNDFGAFAAAPASSNDFGAFAAAPAPPVSPNNFGAFAAAPAASDNFSFDAFGTSSAAAVQPQAVAFNAFGQSAMNSNMGGMNNGMGGMQGTMGGMNNAFGNMTMGQPAMGGGMPQQPTMGGLGPAKAPAAADDDDFGDFADAAPAKVVVKSSDPLSKLISLDGLSKNPKKEDKLSEPVVVNDAAAHYVKSQQDLMAQGGMQAVNQAHAAMSFKGLDGLNSMSMSVPTGYMANQSLSQTPVVVTAGGKDAISSMMGPTPVQPTPQQLMQQQQQQMLAQQQLMMGNQQGMMGMNNMMGSPQAGMMGNNMMGTPQMGVTPGMPGAMGMQGGMMANNSMQQMGGMNPQQMMMMGGQGMMANNMMGAQGMMGAQQQQMMGGMMQGGMGGMQQQPMGGQSNPNSNMMGGMQQQPMGGQPNPNSNMMGGQQMGGWL